MNHVFLEAATLDGLPPVLAGVVVLVFFFVVLGGIIANGAGRPNSQ